MSVDLIAAALIVAFAAVVGLGHVLVIAAIYRILREDHAGGGRRASSDPTTATDDANRAAGAASLGETIEPQHVHAFGARWLSRFARRRQIQDPGLRTVAERT
jgi:hypothetical protein